MNNILTSLSGEAGLILIGIALILLIRFITPIGNEIIAYFRKQEELIANKVGVEKYNATLEKAKLVWGEVDEYFRITPTVTKTIDEAQSLFAVKLKAIVPTLTDEEIEHFRQAVAGIINKGKDDLTSSVGENSNKS